MRPSTADIDRRKARIVACLYPTRIKRGFKTVADCKRLAAMLGVSGGTIYHWEDGHVLARDEQLPAIEGWLASGPVWRYDRIDHVVGPESWPEPLDVTGEPPRQRPLSRGEKAFSLTAAADPASEVGVQPDPA